MRFNGIGIGLSQIGGGGYFVYDFAVIEDPYLSVRFFSDYKDKWVWDVGGSNEFVASEARRFIDDISFTDGYRCTKWNKYVHHKISFIFSFEIEDVAWWINSLCLLVINNGTKGSFLEKVCKISKPFFRFSKDPVNLVEPPPILIGLPPPPPAAPEESPLSHRFGTSP
ncbi:unnamed protein product [Lactuca saligna]|uniref:Uncharacterized protein n=1 Tax=Lactuca saligna TaxID=75948 RepID=A0AA36A2Z7_LACSI|nr:unnamed protein product [Lactuca saligna]